MMKKGFTILETVVALSMLMIVVVSVLPMIGWLSVRSRRLQADSQAALVLLETMEATYSVLASAWISFAPGNTFFPIVIASTGVSEWSLTPGVEVDYQTKYTRWVEMRNVCRKTGTGELKELPCDGEYPEDPDSRKVKAVVKWRDGDREKIIDAELLIVNMAR
ncbi:hypothetical protein A3H89_02640 [Candidatus Amesbacteria bacterium RIFCSPLOWO2_02_FULL_48_11]|uniref:Prepilin-type N-terminal cleavage/methylation domain-containing protein n=3 Tax=Candidatus Amesiibacteriota TaxID=1752730 RepID=A0A1F5A258_9BACT|nr:MAG: hypothetical protein A3H89_02640 [Candidatus Amesbacteria bacterium RIFCSPLOWO2_02_FULL_48_11]OGD12166.1 MAG: hypothetical protein A2576_04690 [Candidatus Amesbacteria bacterium RIFOXYD1_FULL_47_9]